MGRSAWPELRRALEAGGLGARVLGVALRGELWVLELAVAERGLPGVVCVPLAFESDDALPRLHERWAGREVRLAVAHVSGRVAFLREDDELGSDPDLVALRRRLHHLPVTTVALWRLSEQCTQFGRTARTTSGDAPGGNVGLPGCVPPFSVP